MHVFKSKDGAVNIVYAEPREGLQVRPGMLLVKGHWNEGVFQGQAYEYHPCGVLPYNVTGRRIDESLVLEGLAPRVRPGTCTVLRLNYIRGVSNSVLKFDPLPTQEYTQ